MTLTSLCRLTLVGVVFLFTGPRLYAEEDLSGYKAAPVRPPTDAVVMVEDQQILDDCDPDKVCIEGNLYNPGAKTAHRVKLRVEVGGGKYAKPRTEFFTPLDKNTLEAGARMGFSVIVNRKIPYKDKTGEEKTIEAGKYNIKLVPIWSNTELKIAPKKPARKK